MSQTPPDGDDPGTTDASGDTAAPGASTDYPAAPAPGQQETTQPDLGEASTGPSPAEEAPSAAATERRRTSRRTSIVVVTVIGAVVLLAALVLVIWLLSGGRDTSGPGSADASTEPSVEPTPSADPSTEEPASGCTSDLCSEAESLVSATHIGGDGAVWALQGTWSDVADAPNESTGSGTARYASDDGEVTLTLVGFADADEAAAHAETVMADLGEPDSTRPVWDDPQDDRGEGAMSTFTVDGRRVLVWYDDAGVVSVLEGSASTDPESVGQFYFTFPAI